MRVKRTRLPVLPPPAPAPVCNQLQIPTEWFDYPFVPFNVGEYETQVSVLSPITRHHWNGSKWLEIFFQDWEDFPRYRASKFQQFRFRGLKEKPE